MADRYVVNVAKLEPATAVQPARYHHYCRIELPCGQQLAAVMQTVEIAKRFPSSEGFKLDLTRWSEVGHAVQYLEELTKS